MNRSTPQMQVLLYPLTLLYRIGVGIRNWMFDAGILNSKKYDLPIISLGNITVGGTGKTPHTEYLLRLLQPFMNVAMLSRGYKRETKGFVFADRDSSSLTIGDEPYQIKRKFPDVVVAVDANRCRGIERILDSIHGSDLGAIVLDDAYQHRYVEPGISILLVDYNRMITKDQLLPAGNLREPVGNKKRANIVIVTKCPEGAQPIDFRIITKELDLKPYQNLYFTRYKYSDMQPVFPQFQSQSVSEAMLTSFTYDILLFTGIVSQHSIVDYLMQFSDNLSCMEYPDHHHFQAKDLEDIKSKFETIFNPRKIIVTTEKDAARLLSLPDFPSELKKYLYYLPIEVDFLFDHKKDFNEQILGYVRKNKTNRGLFTK